MATAAKKAAKKIAKATRTPQVVTFKKAAKEDTLPKQAAVILEIVQKAGTLTTAELKEKMAAKITDSTQEMSALWGFYQKRLREGGYLTVKKAA